MASLAYLPIPHLPHPSGYFLPVFPRLHRCLIIYNSTFCSTSELCFSTGLFPTFPLLVFHGFRALAVYGPFVCFEALGDGSKYANSFL